MHRGKREDAEHFVEEEKWGVFVKGEDRKKETERKDRRDGNGEEGVEKARRRDKPAATLRARWPPKRWPLPGMK
jgi:hypothetical protein